VSFFSVVSRLNGLLYRRDLARLGPQDRLLARAWMIQFMKSNHPDWDAKKLSGNMKTCFIVNPWPWMSGKKGCSHEVVAVSFSVSL